MTTNSINTEAINLLLSTSSDINLNVAIWLTSLKLWQNHILKGARFVLASCESLGFRILLPTRIHWSWHWLAHWVGIKLTSIGTNNWFAQVWCFAYKNSIYRSFTGEDNRRTAQDIFSYLLEQNFIRLCKRIKFWISRFMQTNIAQTR